MYCKWCQKETEKTLGKHLNFSHKKTLQEYFECFPEDKEIYKKTIKPCWCKGMTKETNPVVAKIAEQIKEFSNRPEMKKARSESMKERYKNGDILTPEQRARVVKIGSDAWVKKVKEATQEERNLLMKPFTDAGNDSQNSRRPSLTLEDYTRLYPFAKGEFVHKPCSNCSTPVITCDGGSRKSARSLYNFCSDKCKDEFTILHPNWQLGKKITYFSIKNNKEIFLLSNLEKIIAQVLDESTVIKTWDVCPFIINYKFKGKKRKYYPDFIIDNKVILEVKSDYVFGLHAEQTTVKLQCATKWAIENNFIFLYWEFSKTPSLNEIKKDERVKRFLLG